MASVLKVDTIKSLAGNEAMTISESGLITPITPIGAPLEDWPRITVTRPNDSSGLAYNTWTELTSAWNTPVNEYGGTFSGGRFTPNVPGWYMVSVNITMQASACTLWGIGVGSNGNLYRNSFIRTGSSGSQSCSPTMTIPMYCNGTTSFTSLFFYLGATSGGSLLNAFIEAVLIQRVDV